jgi:hypothetical protein
LRIAFGYGAVAVEALAGSGALRNPAYRIGQIAPFLGENEMNRTLSNAKADPAAKAFPADVLLTVIAASALAADEHVAQATSLGVKHFLPEPYTAETLLKTVSLLLRSSD